MFYKKENKEVECNKARGRRKNGRTSHRARGDNPTQLINNEKVQMITILALITD